MGERLEYDPAALAAHAEGADSMASELEGASAFDPAEFQAPMLAGLGPIGAPFIASFLAAVANHKMTSEEVVAGLRAHAQSTRDSLAQYEGTDAEQAAELEAATFEEAADELESGELQASQLPGFLKDQLEPLNPGESERVGVIASSIDQQGHGGIKGADLGVPARLKDGTPVMLFGDSNKPGDIVDKDHGYYGSIVAATVENTPDGVKVTGIDGWGSQQLLAEQPPPNSNPDKQQRSYPQGVITLDDRQLLTIGNVITVDKGTPQEDDFYPVNSHMVEIGGKEGGWPTVDQTRPEQGYPSYATGLQVEDKVFIAGCSGHTDTPVTLYEVPVDQVTDRSTWSNYAIGTVNGADSTPQMSKIGDQYYLSYMGPDGLNVMISDSPANFANGGVQAQNVALPNFTLPQNEEDPGAAGAYGGYILPNSQPDDLRFAVSYFAHSGLPYGVDEYRYRPR